MLTRFTSKLPRIVYFTIKRFGSLLAWAVGGLLLGLGLVQLLTYSAQLLGSPLPVLAALAVGLAVLLSYFAAKWDVEEEKREQDKVLRELSRD